MLRRMHRLDATQPQLAQINALTVSQIFFFKPPLRM
jgi:hypothetical protein